MWRGRTIKANMIIFGKASPTALSRLLGGSSNIFPKIYWTNRWKEVWKSDTFLTFLSCKIRSAKLAEREYVF
jgi:hypothetical protein